MTICLKTCAKQNEVQHTVILLQERLPQRVISPAELNCHFHVASYDDYYLLTLDVSGSLEIACQRCLQAFRHDYCNKTVLAVCASEAMAEALMEHHECVVADDAQVNLVDVLTDELYLFSPVNHANSVDCDVEMSQWIGKQNEILTTTLGL